ncbi:MAG TPA: glycosyltransferase family 87 protein [Xanthobacteraceae bacterium]|nr:glycosyltransferase family 87 protein [Xanthobacteraceae bacterium]
MPRVWQALRNGDWLTRERIRLIAAAVLIASIAGFAFLVATAHGGVDRQGRPLGTDFSNVYAAGTYVLEAEPDVPFDPPRQYAREQELFGKATPFYGWHYPPYFLFVAGALAKLPYGVALTVWQGSTLLLYLLMILGIASPSPRVRGEGRDEGASPPGSESRRGPLTLLRFAQSTSPRPAGRGDILLLALAYPAVLINIGHGQNGFLTAALLGGALIVLDRRPILAGILIGLLVYKPQFGLMIPLALVAGGHWRTFAAAAATVAALTLVTTLAFGPEVWPAFKASTEFSRSVVLEQGQTGWQKIQSVFSWARMWGAPIPLAYALQGALTIAIGVVIVRVWRSAAAPALKSATLCVAAILATPYSLDYDMMVLAPVIAFFALDGLRRGFGPWEKTALAALWLVPLLARSVAQATLIPLGVPAMLATCVLLLRRVELDRTHRRPSTLAVPL